jgi:multiple sugar transport system substrate-binding protein
MAGCRRVRLLLCALLALGTAGPAAAATELRYMLWDSLQLPQYRRCAADFERANPGTRIRFVQVGWGDYWTTLATGFVSETAPDVFTNHLAKFPELVRNEQLVDLTPLMQRDGVTLADYEPGLAEVWQRSGRQYGLPKDWDTVALAVNLSHAAKAGVARAEFESLTWNPRDGGTLEALLRRLTIDRHGRNANDPAFDRRAIAVYGYQNHGPGGMAGQTEWSHYAHSAGWQFQPAPWAGRYFYDDPRLVSTIDWLGSLPGKGLSAPYEQAKGLGADAMFAAGRVALLPMGSWMVNFIIRNARFEFGFVPLPTGPSGQRTSMRNGLADSIWIGTRHKEQAWAWVRHLASAACQQQVAGFGVTFPARRGLAAQAIAAQGKLGADTRAYLTMAEGTTFATPIDDHAAEIDDLIKGAIESVLVGRQTAAPALAAANARANALLQKKRR